MDSLTEADSSIEKAFLQEKHQAKLSHIICDIDGELIERLEIFGLYWILPSSSV
jgi:hypothetical protein